MNLTATDSNRAPAWVVVSVIQTYTPKILKTFLWTLNTNYNKEEQDLTS